MYINTHTRHPQKMSKKVIKLIICWLKGGNLVVRTSDTGKRGLLFIFFFFFYLWCISYSANLKRQNENQKTLLPRYWGFWVLPKLMGGEDFTSAVCSSLSLPSLPGFPEALGPHKRWLSSVPQQHRLWSQTKTPRDTGPVSSPLWASRKQGNHGIWLQGLWGGLNEKTQRLCLAETLGHEKWSCINAPDSLFTCFVNIFIGLLVFVLLIYRSSL